MGILAGLALAALAVWVVLVFGRGGFWLTGKRLLAGVEPSEWPSVVAVVPARDEAAVLPETLPTLLAQAYPGRFRVVLVDDGSTDGTGDLARSLGDVQVVRARERPEGWAGLVRRHGGITRLVNVKLSEQNTGIGIRHGDPDGCVALNRAITRMYQDGTARKLVSKWFGGTGLDISIVQVPQFDGCD